jgi:hypothetical protein
MIFLNHQEGLTIYTNVCATSTSLVKKYLPNISVLQIKVRTPFDPENFAQLNSENLLTTILSADVPTPPVDSYQSLRSNRL